VFYFVLFVGAFILVSRSTETSVPELLRTLAKEFGDLLTLKPTAGAVNALGVICMFAWAVIYNVAQNFREVAEATNQAHKAGAHSDHPVFYFGGLLILLVAIGSVMAVKRR
jgi:uncharacterized membrane protein